MKFAFLLRQETEVGSDPSFYDFIPYKYGPFSFLLYRELAGLRGMGFLSDDEKTISLTRAGRREHLRHADTLPCAARAGVERIVSEYGQFRRRELVASVYRRYPWYATRSEDSTQARRRHAVRPRRLKVYTAGYEGRSVDAFFDMLLKSGVNSILDVRANPASRKYGFSRKSLAEIAHKLDLQYRHLPTLGIRGEHRSALSDFESYQRLLHRYERQMLPKRLDEVYDLVKLIRARPSVLVCVERNHNWCHRSCLARAAALLTGLPVVHL